MAGAAALGRPGTAFADSIPGPSPVRHGPAASLTDIDHVVILMQENRSFDHYFGSLSGVRGFSDPDALIQPTGQSVFYQPDADRPGNPSGQPYVLPWHFDTTKFNAQASQDLSHAWEVQHYSWNSGLMDGFVTTHRVADDATSGGVPTTNYGTYTMGYFDRSDIPYHYAPADAYTVCDAYHCSVFGPTDPNRIMLMSGTIDVDGTLGGGPCIDNSQTNGQLKWKSYPELLQAAGINWYLYQETDNFTDNMLPYFAGFNDTTTDLYRRGNSFIPTPAGQRYGPALAEKLAYDVQHDQLPQVSYIVGSYLNSEHPEATPGYGARFVNEVIQALTSDPAVWARTALIINFDENDGYFDHVLPPTAPAGTPGEWLTEEMALANPSASFGKAGPVGLGFRVPMLVVSPFSRGGLVCSEVFDHTSVIKFLERRFGVECPYISEWRRDTVGDLTSAFNFAAGRNTTLPRLPDADALAAAADQQASLPAPVMPSSQSMPTQEPGRRPVPSGLTY